MNPKIPMDASTSDANKHTNIPGSPSRTFGLAVGAVLVVLFPQQLGQDELVLLVQLLRLLPARARRHRGGVDAGSSRAGRAGGRAAGRAGGRRGRSYSAGKRRPRRLEKEGRRRRRRRRQQFQKLKVQNQSPWAKIKQGYNPSGGSRGQSVPCLFQLLGAAAFPRLWPHCSNLQGQHLQISAPSPHSLLLCAWHCLLSVSPF